MENSLDSRTATMALQPQCDVEFVDVYDGPAK